MLKANYRRWNNSPSATQHDDFVRRFDEFLASNVNANGLIFFYFAFLLLTQTPSNQRSMSVESIGRLSNELSSNMQYMHTHIHTDTVYAADRLWDIFCVCVVVLFMRQRKSCEDNSEEEKKNLIQIVAYCRHFGIVSLLKFGIYLDETGKNKLFIFPFECPPIRFTIRWEFFVDNSDFFQVVCLNWYHKNKNHRNGTSANGGRKKVHWEWRRAK